MKIRISNREFEFLEIDDEDYDFISKHKWAINNDGYIYTSIKRKYTLLHRMLLDLKTRDGKMVDHKDGNPLNNKRDNLRLCTPSQNTKNSRIRSDNSSGFKGVRKKGKKWLAHITYEGKKRPLGSYSDKIEAAKAYDKAADNHHREFAKLNFDKDSEHHFSKDITSSFNFYKVGYSSEYYGVSFVKRDENWQASIYKYGYIGLFKTEVEAALAVDNYIIKNNLDKSKLNFTK